jgi:hypothetical protein
MVVMEELNLLTQKSSMTKDNDGHYIDKKYLQRYHEEALSPETNQDLSSTNQINL